MPTKPGVPAQGNQPGSRQTRNEAKTWRLGGPATPICVQKLQDDMDVNCTGTNNGFKPAGTYGVLSTSIAAYDPDYSTRTGRDFAADIGSVNATHPVNVWPTGGYSSVTAIARRLPACREAFLFNALFAPSIERKGRLRATVDVVEANDVVLAQITAGLHLDQLQQHFAGVAQTVRAAEWNKGALVFAEQEHFLVAGDLSSA